MAQDQNVEEIEVTEAMALEGAWLIPTDLPGHTLTDIAADVYRAMRKVALQSEGEAPE